MLLAALRAIDPLVLIKTLPAEPVPVFALEMALLESMLNIPRLKLTEPAAADVNDALETVPSFCSTKELALTVTSPPMPLLPAAAMAKMPVEKKSKQPPSMRSE